MRGEVVSVDAVSGAGEIMSPDGRKLTFRASSCLGPVEVGQAVDYVELTGDAAGEITPAAPGLRFSKRRPPREPGAMDWGALFMSSEGRLRRSHYWIGIVILMVASQILRSIPLISLISAIVIYVLIMALQARRLRDFGQSAWWLLVPLAVSVAGWFSTMVVYSLTSPSPFGIITPRTAGLFSLIVVIVIGVIPGQRGRNRFGPDTKPAAPEDTAEAFT